MVIRPLSRRTAYFAFLGQAVVGVVIVRRHISLRTGDGHLLAIAVPVVLVCDAESASLNFAFQPAGARELDPCLECFLKLNR